MTDVDHEHVTYWWKRAKRAERLLRRIQRQEDRRVDMHHAMPADLKDDLDILLEELP